MIKSPCYNCADRKVGCHSECDLYSDYKKRKFDRHEAIRREKIRVNADKTIRPPRRKK